MAKLYPYIYCENAREQAAFYAKALGGKIVGVQTFAEIPNVSDEMKDKVMHLVLQTSDLVLFMADSVSEPVKRGGGLDLGLEYKTEQEARQVFEGLSQGGSVIMPFEKMFWGSMFGRLQDPYGVFWQIVTEPS
ncbi:PhnB protein [Paenibacillus sp. 1_12]|uniref:VOC family protein n=1 Tax=Paenibacillus sp. 1_12 TaxID=1566278 RepID=UPI0008E5DB6C|nr:VOC family protein [Paenibacillus sp. 1_12]SFL36110.1 PhnB protein [Paenibacillus sp. 1_12]